MSIPSTNTRKPQEEDLHDCPNDETSSLPERPLMTSGFDTLSFKYDGPESVDPLVYGIVGVLTGTGVGKPENSGGFIIPAADQNKHVFLEVDTGSHMRTRTTVHGKASRLLFVYNVIAELREAGLGPESWASMKAVGASSMIPTQTIHEDTCEQLVVEIVRTQDDYTEVSTKIFQKDQGLNPTTLDKSNLSTREG